MVTMAQRIEALRTERGLSRPALSAALGFSKNAVEKFETGRQTPAKEQQEKLASYFGVSLFYLRGESNDRTRQETWMDMAQDEPEPVPSLRQMPKPAAPVPAAGPDSGTVFDSFLSSRPFRELLSSVVLETMRSSEGQKLIAQAVRRELDRQNQHSSR